MLCACMCMYAYAYVYGVSGLCVHTGIVLCCRHAHAVACDATPCRMLHVHSLGVTREIKVQRYSTSSKELRFIRS